MHIVCPLEFERSALRGLSRRAGVGLDCCGPGSAAVAAWAAAARLPAGARVVLAGVAGGLCPRIPPGSAREAFEVRDAAGGSQPLRPNERMTTLPLARVVSVPAALTDAGAKRALRGDGARPGDADPDLADLVDLESAAFAREAVARGWRWSVVRGVSDGALEALPEAAEGWTDARGRTLPARVAASLLRRPALAPDVVRLARRSSQAMRLVAQALGAAIGSNGSTDD